MELEEEEQMDHTDQVSVREDIEDDINEDLYYKILTKSEKYKIVSPISERIIDAILRNKTRLKKRS